MQRLFSLTLVIVLVIGSMTLSAKSTLDSLENVLQQTNDPLQQVDILYEFSAWYTSLDYYKCLEFANRSLQLAEDLDYHLGIAKAYQRIGMTHWFHADYPNSRIALVQAIDIFRKLSASKLLAESLNTFGLTYYYTSDYDTALVLLGESLDYFESIADSSNISRVMNNLGLVNRAIGNFEEAIRLIVDGLRYEVRYSSLIDQANSAHLNTDIHSNEFVVGSIMKDKMSKIRELEQLTDTFRLAMAISEVGALYQLIEEYDSAFSYFHRSSAMFQQIGINSRYLLELIDIGDGFMQLGQLDSAKYYYEQCWDGLLAERMLAPFGSLIYKLANIEREQSRPLQALALYEQGIVFADSIGHRASKSRFFALIAETNLLLGKVNVSNTYGVKALELAEELGSFLQRKQALKVLYDIQEALGDHVKALTYFQQYTAIIIAEMEAEVYRESEEYKAKMELNVKAMEIDRLSRENKNISEKERVQRDYILVILIGFMIVLILLVKVVTRNKRIHQLNKEITHRSDQNEMLLREIHHRVKNNLQMVSSILSMQARRLDDRDPAEILQLTQNRIHTIGLIHEHLYQNDNYHSVEIKSYVPRLIDLVISTQTHKRPQVEYQFKVETVELDLMISVGLILNELITNSVKYAFPQVENPVLFVSMNSAGGKCILTCQDNGPGVKDMKKGFGWSIIDSLVDSFDGSVTRNSDKGMFVKVEFFVR
ncbi:MAG: tetratricopeptide repeat protein [Cyclobacteriaceae bacterium]